MSVNVSDAAWREPSAAPVVGGALVIGAGGLDLDLQSSGLHHLVEHLVMRRFGSSPLSHNAVSTPEFVAFYASGSPGEVLSFLDGVVAAMNSLRLDLTAAEVELEQKVLGIEFVGRGGGRVGPLTVRYGVEGPGLLDLPEIGAYTSVVDDVRTFLSRWCVAENAQIILNFDPGVDVSIDLPRGVGKQVPRRQPQLASSRKGYGFTEADGVTLSIETVGRPGDVLVLEVLRLALQHELRQENGLVYSVLTDLCPTGTGTQTAVLSMEALPEAVDTIVHTALGVVDELRTVGPSATMLELARGSILGAMDGPDDVLNDLLVEAVRRLRGQRPDDQAAARRAYARMTTAEVAARLGTISKGLVVTVPEGAMLWPLAAEALERHDLPLIELIPTDSRPAREVRADLAKDAGLTGARRWFRSRVWRGNPAKRFGPMRGVRLWARAGQLSLFPRQAAALRVAARDVVLVETADDGTVLLLTRRGGRLMVNPGHFWGARRGWARFVDSLPEDTVRQ